MSQPQQPSIGRVVHYTPSGYPKGTFFAGVIASIHDDGRLNLGVFGALGELTSARGIEHTEEPAGSEGAIGKWSWPARVG